METIVYNEIKTCPRCGKSMDKVCICQIKKDKNKPYCKFCEREIHKVCICEINKKY